LEAGEADVGAQVVGLAVEDRAAEHAQIVVDNVVCDAGLACACKAGSEAERGQVLAGVSVSGKEQKESTGTSTAQESVAIVC